MPADGPWILVVDDDAAFREAIRHVLEWEGYAADMAADGEEALTLVAARPPALLIVDLRMPVMDGAHCIATLRAAGYTMPVIVVSASAVDRTAVLLGQVEAYLPKPFDLGQLLSLVRRLLPAARPTVHDACGCAAETP